MAFFFDTPVDSVRVIEGGYEVVCGEKTYRCARGVHVARNIVN